MPVDATTVAAATPRPRPYRHYLTSALHTRFVHAVLLALLNSFLVAFWTGKDYFWSWFPFGPAGLKAMLFTISSLFVFVLQLSTMQIGRRTSPSSMTMFSATILDMSSYQTVFWYIVSAWWFCEAYIWAVPAHYNMGWIVRGDPDSPDRLNERPIYLRFFFTVLACVQSGLHMYYGQSFLHIPIARPSISQSANSQTHPIASIQSQLQKKLPAVLLRSLLASGVATVVAPFIYKAFFRDLFWRLHLAFAKPFFNLSRADAEPPQTYFIGAILGWAFVVGMTLSFSWEAAAYSFLIYLKQPPLKNGLPLSACSKDPNGTLLNGLIAKRSVVNTFAFWELALIAQTFPDRRRAIFIDFERSNGPMWTSMLKAALAVVSSIDTRILALNPPSPQISQQQEEQQINSLPRIAKDASSKPIFAPFPPPSTRTQKVENFLAITNKALGQSKNPWSPPIKETQQRLLEYTKPAVKPNGNDLQSSISNALKGSALGSFIGTKSTGKVSSVILGSPAGNAAPIVDAIEAITKMLVASLNEDDFGKAIQTVPQTVKQFSRTIMMIEAFVKTNVQNATAEDVRDLEEVSIIADRLKAGLRELITAFQVFLNDAGLGIKDLNEARRASEERPLLPPAEPLVSLDQRPEMEQTGRQPQRQQQLEELQDARQSDRDASDPQDRRARETAQSLRRIESRKQPRISGGDSNVFGARDFNATASSRRGKELVMVG